MLVHRPVKSAVSQRQPSEWQMPAANVRISNPCNPINCSKSLQLSLLSKDYSTSALVLPQLAVGSVLFLVASTIATWMAFDYPKVMAFSDGKRIENGAIVVVALAITVLVTTELAILIAFWCFFSASRNLFSKRKFRRFGRVAESRSDRFFCLSLPIFFFFQVFF